MRQPIQITTEQSHNQINFSKNYRIFGHEEPIYNVSSLQAYADSIDVSDNDESFVARQFRYSTNRLDWSLWYSFSVGAYDNIKNLSYDSEQPLFVEIRVDYDNGSYDALANPVTVNDFTLIFNTTKIQPERNYQFRAQPIEERSPAIAFERQATFRPYAVNEANKLYIGMSYQTNLMWGHEVVYFRVTPDLSSGDFVFKEWTILNATDKRCVKVLVPNNEFPDNKPKFNEFGIDFEMPFEVHIDNSYFQLMFGRDAQPRVRDIIYFPLMDRVYEIKSCFLKRGFMMEPIYWMISLVKYQPSVDLKKGKFDETINSLINSAEDLFKNKVADDTKNATNPQQFKTFSFHSDEIRETINPKLLFKQMNKTYTYIPLIQNYYDMSAIPSFTREFKIDGQLVQLVQETGQKSFVRAYQQSDLFSAWRDHAISTYDGNVGTNFNVYPVRVSGPFDSHSDLGRYIDIQTYSNTDMKAKKNAFLSGTDTVTYRGRDLGVVYKIQSTLSSSLTFSCMFNVPSSATGAIEILRGADAESSQGLKVLTVLSNSSDSFSIVHNDTTTSFPIGSNLQRDAWYSLVVSVSSQFGQVGVYLYSMVQDPANANNWNKMNLVYSDVVETPVSSFDASVWTLPAGPYLLANIRVYKTMIQPESHDFILSQLYIKDESLLSLIDNCKQRLSSAFVAVNK